MNLNRYLFLLLAMLVAGFIQGQDEQEVNVPIVSKAVYFDVTPPLRDMPIVLPGERDRSWKDNIIQNKSMEDEFKNMVEPTSRKILSIRFFSKSILLPVKLQDRYMNFDGVGNVNGVYSA